MNERLKVLVVDDDRRMVKTICDILKVEGYTAIQAYSGDEAQQKVRENHPDCVIMDIKMPGIDGVEATAMIKSVSPDLPVVLMSAYATEDQINEAKKQGAYTVLTKPIDVQQILFFLSLLRKEESILVVDDDPAFSRTLRDILQASGYNVDTEADPEKVLGQMERTYKLVVLLDLNLGSVNGLDILQAIRARYPGKPVVLITGYREAMASSIETGLQIGAYACLYKPFAIEELTGIIEEISRGKLKSLLGEPFKR
ncbi:MAG: response regulator [Deltaproteobacteria bacterium]|nr:response regulator [Deltaproteobacteria bacterium]